MSARRRIAVLSGGRSSEHEVSLVSAEAIVAALDPERYDVTTILIDRDGCWSADGIPVTLAPTSGDRGHLMSLDGGFAIEVDLVFPVLHGPYGEDGTVQGLCEMAGVPYVGSGVAASALAMDKALFKAFLRDTGIPTAVGEVVMASEWERDPAAVRARIAGRVGYPAFCKPARLGSSVGISPVPTRDDLAAALDLAFAHDPKALVERAIRGQEVEVGVLGEEDLEVSPVGELSYDGEWYDYETKYRPGRMRLIIPARIDQDAADRARELAAAAFRAVGCSGMARVDFFVTEGGDVLLSELNTIPGFTPTSVYASLMGAGGVGYRELIDRLVGLAFARAEGDAAVRH